MDSVKKGEKYEGYYYLKYFFIGGNFNQTLSMYAEICENKIKTFFFRPVKQKKKFPRKLQVT